MCIRDRNQTKNREIGAGEPLIQVKELCKSFDGVDVLKNITTTIKKGEVVFVVGPSGSGKSTFLRCMNLLEEPTSGHIFFEGTDITDKNTDINLLRQKMGMVFQQFNLFPHMSIMKNKMCIRDRPMTHSWGQRVVRFYDPDGNLIEVGTPV